MKIVLDASAVAKWFLKEDGSSEMRALRSLIAEGVLAAIAPTLLVELANVLC